MIVEQFFRDDFFIKKETMNRKGEILAVGELSKIERFAQKNRWDLILGGGEVASNRVEFSRLDPKTGRKARYGEPEKPDEVYRLRIEIF